MRDGRVCGPRADGEPKAGLDAQPVTEPLGSTPATRPNAEGRWMTSCRLATTRCYLADVTRT